MEPQPFKMLNVAHIVFFLALFLYYMTYAMPLSLMSQDEQKALPDTMLAENGRHRVKAGETTFGLARMMGLEVNDFHSYNWDAYRAGTSSVGPSQLPAGRLSRPAIPSKYRR